jgi:hypothetical protein
VNAAEFKRRAVALLRNNLGSSTKVEWVWTYKGRAKGAPKDVRTGYAVVTQRGSQPRLFFVDWMEGYPLEVKSQTEMSWLLLSMQDQSVIKGSRGNVPSPADYGVAVYNSTGKRVACGA